VDETARCHASVSVRDPATTVNRGLADLADGRVGF
jgi:hypothetical protein